MKVIDKFNVINYDFNGNKMEEYDIFPYLTECYKRKKNTEKPKTFDEFKSFIEKESMYMWWSRCQYEIILSDWPNQKKMEKWDVYKQIKMNIDLITKTFMDYIK